MSMGDEMIGREVEYRRSGRQTIKGVVVATAPATLINATTNDERPAVRFQVRTRRGLRWTDAVAPQDDDSVTGRMQGRGAA